MSACVLEWLKSWSAFICTGILAIVALVAPYCNAQLLRKRNAPKLDIEFDEKKYCRHTQTGKKKEPYFCHFAVVNNGVNQADDCEAVLEKIWKKKQGRPERQDFIPVNLKWSAERKGSERACFKTIYSGGRKYFCDIARIDPKEKLREKFTFELARTFISQDDYLPPDKDKYEIQISVYSKNAAKKTKKFDVKWFGGWSENQEEMQKKHLKVEML